MAPKKKEQQKMSLGAFLQEEKFGGSWADEVEEFSGSQPLPAPTNDARRNVGSGYSSYGGLGNDRPYPTRERDSFPQELPTKPPYTAHLGNLSYDATTETITEFFEGCDLTSVRIIEDRELQRPKGFAYAEFKDVEGLKKALTFDGQSFQGRNIRVRIADPPRNRDAYGSGESSARDLPSWERKGPLADLPGARSERRSEYGERRGPPREFDEPRRDFSNMSWERRGPLSPLPQQERSGSREGSRPRSGESFRRDRRASPATWGEGTARPDSRPPRERTAAEIDDHWRTSMRPDRAGRSSGQSREGSEAPPSPAMSAAQAPASRPKLHLQKRTVSDAPGVASPPPASASDSKSNPFGAARPIDTATREREITEKKEHALKEKREAEEKAKEERRVAKEAAAKEATEKAAAAATAAEAPVEAEKETITEEKAEPTTETTEAPKDVQSEEQGEQKVPIRPKEVQNPKSRAAESINWRTPSGEGRGGRGGYQNAPRGGRGDSRGARGGQRGSRYGDKAPRANGNAPVAAQQPAPAAATAAATGEPATPAEESAPTQDADGWQTVPQRRGRNQGARA